jgi:hypothetical protein
MITIPPYTLRRLDMASAGSLGGRFLSLEEIVEKAKTLEEACKLVKNNYGVLPSPPQLRKYLDMVGIRFEDSSRN